MKPIAPSNTAAQPFSSDDLLVERKVARVEVDRYAMLRLRMTPSTQSRHLQDYLILRDRSRCASTSSQF